MNHSSAFASTAFDLSDFDTPMNGADDLINSLTPTLMNKDVFNQQQHGDSPDSYISGSSEETSHNPIEDFDLYDFGTTCDFATGNSSEPFKFSSSNQNTVSVDDFFKSSAQQQDKISTMKDKTSAFNTNSISPSQAIAAAAAAFPQQVITPQQIQEQFLLLQQQQRAHLAQQQFAFGTVSQMPFANPFMAPYAHIPTFIPPTSSTPSPSPPVLSPKESVKHESPKKSNKKKSSSTKSTSSTSSSNSTTGTKRAREANNKSPSASEALAELDAKKSSGTEDDKEVKRQRRLIKNRESAQASRERKKLYVKGLEAKVEELTTKNSDMSTKLQQLEEENRRLRDRLTYLDPTGLHLQDVLSVSDEPDAKKRRLSKLPLPSQPAYSYNPFDSNFWAAFLGTANVAPAQPSQSEMMAQQARMAWQPVQQSKRVVMFIMLFCVAVMLVLPKDNLQSSLSSAIQSPAVDDSALISPVAVGVQRKNMGKRLLELQDIYDSFSKVQMEAGSNLPELDELDTSKFSVEMDHSTQSLIISFPMDGIKNNTIKVKEEPSEEEENPTCPADSKTEIHVGQKAMVLLKELCANFVNS